ncbi:centriole, cilia and spindle-associated protein [Poecilia formosa]|uniref:centriole, cilia and spindle-associated protein n=1 Tax=Poecilia formosa TaxID=48698 RepID=UPI0007B9C311|nr:PREDICTED: centriole, cilia and spindle-associated protein-like [Poecilia formosa]
MVTKKVRTEYMKKFRDPKWETFSKCYEDSLKYRLTRRVMEHSHKPWIWEGWETASNSSGWSTPRLSRNKVAPLSLPPPPPLPPACSEVKQKLMEVKTSLDLKPEVKQTEEETGETPVVDVAPTADVLENGLNGPGTVSASIPPDTSGPSDDTATDNRPDSSDSSDEKPVNPAPRRRHRCRTPRSVPAQQDSSLEKKLVVVQKPPRAKSQPAISSKANRRPSSRMDGTERQPESNMSAAGVQTQPNRRSSNLDRRRARSADLEKTRRSQLTMAAADDRWMTEYMRCFSARLR